MTQEEKDILMRDLCARLPYGVKCSFGVDDAIYQIDGVNPTCCGASEIQATHIKSGINGDFTLNACKPYLFPLSSMTKVQEDEWYEVFIDPLSKRIDRHTRQEDLQLQANAQAFAVEYLLKNHFDYYGLIPMGLAIDATGLNIY